MFKADEEKHEKGHPHMPGEEKIKSDDYIGLVGYLDEWTTTV